MMTHHHWWVYLVRLGSKHIPHRVRKLVFLLCHEDMRHLVLVESFRLPRDQIRAWHGEASRELIFGLLARTIGYPEVKYEFLTLIAEFPRFESDRKTHPKQNIKSKSNISRIPGVTKTIWQIWMSFPVKRSRPGNIEISEKIWMSFPGFVNKG